MPSRDQGIRHGGGTAGFDGSLCIIVSNNKLDTLIVCQY